MRRIFSGAQRDAIINHDGCCVCCGFIEHGLMATETDNGRFETLCEECLAQKHLEPFSKTVFKAAYLPELSTPVIAHYSRVAAWFYFASRMGEAIDISCGFDGNLPGFTSQSKWWEKKLEYTSFAAAKSDVQAPVDRLRQMRIATQPYAFLKGRIDTTKAMYGDVPPNELLSMFGEEIFSRDFRLVPTAIPLARIRSWGAKGSTFANHPIPSSEPETSPSFDVFFDDLINEKTEN